MAKKIRYYYDAETCSFKKEKLTFASAVKKALSYLTVSGVLACLLIAAFLYSGYDPQKVILENENKRLKSEIGKYEQQFSMLEKAVDELHKKDNEFYRSILNAEPIASGVWNGGTGGTANAELASQPDVLRETEKRLARLSQKVDLQGESYSLLFGHLSENEDFLSHVPSIKPVPGRLISGFGMRMHPIHHIRKRHTGIDLQASKGTPVYATGDGVIKFAGRKANGYGIHIDIDHGYEYVTKYAHLSKVLVKRGQSVKRGDIIGYSGNTGLSKGPHLHYEIIKGGIKIDPIDYFYADLTPEEFIKLREEAMVENTSMD
ncbi:MAG: M23 family metallopeptidase [Bacteroidetes bacterium]|nr:MAG: M23 family metallopeptidase [Bacteroidota bacterium]